jgi:hypothetical protein
MVDFFMGLLACTVNNSVREYIYPLILNLH